MKTIRIAFTGHRDTITDIADLAAIHAAHPGALWVHGGAAGFDRQVGAYAESRNIPYVVMRPDYARLPKKSAPIVRNRRLVDGCDLLVACYDWRETGGTYYTVSYARKIGRPIQYVKCVALPEEERRQPKHWEQLPILFRGEG